MKTVFPAIHFKPIGMLEHLAPDDRPQGFVRAKIADNVVGIPAQHHAAKIKDDTGFHIEIVIEIKIVIY